MREIKTVTVLGATGTMGAQVCGIFAAFGNAKVYMVCRDRTRFEAARKRACDALRTDSIGANLLPADYTSLADCVAQSDLIFESTAENAAVKRTALQAVAAAMRDDAVVCTGSSGLSVTALTDCFPEARKARLFGVHMFNPPYKMPLCELIATPFSDATLKRELHEYLSRTLYRTVVEVSDTPAFLANRIGFQFINEMLQKAETYRDNGGIDYIDAILGPFTGRAMPPLLTADFVGLDVHQAIVDNLYENTADYAHDSFRMPAFAEQLVAKGRLGKKTGGGLYKTELLSDGRKRRTVYDISTGRYRDKIAYSFPFAERMMRDLKTGDYRQALEALVQNRSQEAQICLSSLMSYLLYGLYTAEQVGQGMRAADDVMAEGFNWCPPLALLGALRCAASTQELLTRCELPQSFDAAALLERAEQSQYDYRLYFKSVR